jgi:hypothetical protein
LGVDILWTLYFLDLFYVLFNINIHVYY